MIKKIILFFSLALPCLSNAYNLPNLGSSTGNTISSIQEEELGKKFIRMVHQQIPLLKDPVVTEYIQQLGQQLVQHSKTPKAHFEFFVVRSKEINAFAGPGGYVGVNAGTILTAKSEGELAAVMAHEIAHVTQRHIARMIGEQKSLALANIATMVAAIAVGMQNAQAGAGLASASAAGNIQNSINTTRGFEREADHIGMQTLANSGYSPNKMPRFFARMQAQTRLNGTQNVPAILLTHPLTSERLADAENRSRAFKPTSIKPHNPTFYLIKARVLVDMSGNPKTLIARFAHRKSLSTVDQYTYALALFKAREFKKAKKFFNQLSQQYPSQKLFKLDQSHLFQHLNDKTSAINTAKSVYKSNSNNKVTLLNYAQLLIKQKHYKKAATLLKQHEIKFSTDVAFLSTLSMAQGKSGKIAEAYETRAKIYLLHDNTHGALIQLEQALKFTKNRYTRARIQHKIQRLKNEK